MSTDQAKQVYKHRKQLVEPVFGILKEQRGARRFLLRGSANVAAEWALLATTFNLRTLWRIWRTRTTTSSSRRPRSTAFSAFRWTRLLSFPQPLLAQTH